MTHELKYSQTIILIHPSLEYSSINTILINVGQKLKSFWANGESLVEIKCGGKISEWHVFVYQPRSLAGWTREDASLSQCKNILRTICPVKQAHPVRVAAQFSQLTEQKRQTEDLLSDRQSWQTVNIQEAEGGRAQIHLYIQTLSSLSLEVVFPPQSYLTPAALTVFLCLILFIFQVHGPLKRFCDGNSAVCLCREQTGSQFSSLHVWFLS